MLHNKYLAIFLTGVCYFFLCFYIFTQSPSVIASQPSDNNKLKLTSKKTYIPLSNNGSLIKNDNKYKLMVKDYLSSTRLIIDDKGNITNTISYYPYGAQTNSTNSTNSTNITDKLFTGHRQLDDNLSVIHAGARFYSPDLGLFIQPDTVQGPNRYAYAANNPIFYNDLSGNTIKSGHLPQHDLLNINESGGTFIMEYPSGINQLIRLYTKVFFRSISFQEAIEILNNYANSNYEYQLFRVSQLKGQDGITGLDILNTKTVNEAIELAKQADPSLKFIENDMVTLVGAKGLYVPKINTIIYMSSLNESDQIKTIQHEILHSLSMNQNINQLLSENPDMTRQEALNKIFMTNSIFNEEAMTYGSTLPPGYLFSTQSKDEQKNIMLQFYYQGYCGLFGPYFDYYKRTGLFSPN